MNATAAPFVLVLLLNEPAFGLALQVTPAESFVAALSESFWPSVRPARVGEIETEMTGGGELELLEEWLEDEEELLEEPVELLEDEEELPIPEDQRLLDEEPLLELVDEEVLPEDAVELEEEERPADGVELSFF